MRSVSLFSNCGAGDLGYRAAGFRFVVMAERDRRRLEVALLNHPGAVGVTGDLRETWSSVVESYRKSAGEERPSLLAACPPCQGMSTARSDRGKESDPDAGSRDERNLLVVIIAKVTNELEPSIIVVENVPAFLTRTVRHPQTQEPISAAKLLIETLENDYEVFPFLTDLCDYGVPQIRQRTFLTFLRRDVDGLASLRSRELTPYPLPTHVPENGGAAPITLRSALDSFTLPSLDASSPEKASSPDYELHFVPVWEDRRYDVVAAIPPNTGASAWENNQCETCGSVQVEPDDATCPNCQGPLLRPIVREEDGEYRLVRGYRSSSYRRMYPDQPAATITTASGHWGSSFNIHPFENRLMSPLECALLQTFPKDFDWGEALDKWGHTNVRIMIGEAVPPRFTELHGQVLVEALTGRFTQKILSRKDQRCSYADKKLEILSSRENSRGR